MKVYLIEDFFRIDGITGDVIEKEFQDDLKKYYQSICLEGGRNEYLSFQVILQTENETIDKMEIDFSDLNGEETISKAQYKVFIEWFHQVNGKYVPDALVPLKETNLDFKVPLDNEYLKDQKVGALWIDLFIPEEVLPGDYSGNIIVSANGIKTVFNIDLKVHDVILCDESMIYADLNNYADNISPVFPHLADNEERYNDGSFFEVEKEFYRLAREHRSVFHNLGYLHSGTVVDSFAPELEGEGKNIRVKSWDRFDKHFGPYLDGSAFNGLERRDWPVEFLYLPFNFRWPSHYRKWGKKGHKTEYRRILTEFVKHFEEKGWSKTYLEFFFNHKKRYRFFPYDGDETRFFKDEEIISMFDEYTKDIFEATDLKFTFRVDSSWCFGHHYDSKLSDICNMWIASQALLSWYPESVQVMKEKGNILWFYGGGGLSDLDKSLISLFNAPILSIMNGVGGFVLWNTTGFGKDSLKTPKSQGAETVFYPGSRFGYNLPIPSIRLKALRNYMQIVDKIRMHENTGLDEEAKKIINKHYDVDEHFWWGDRPEFTDNPPNTWTNANFSDARAYFYDKAVSPSAIGKIHSDVLRLLSGGVKDE